MASWHKALNSSRVCSVKFPFRGSSDLDCTGVGFELVLSTDPAAAGVAATNARCEGWESEATGLERRSTERMEKADTCDCSTTDTKRQRTTKRALDFIMATGTVCMGCDWVCEPCCVGRVFFGRGRSRVSGQAQRTRNSWFECVSEESKTRMSHRSSGPNTK
jgi:hypothetical protein